MLSGDIRDQRRWAEGQCAGLERRDDSLAGEARSDARDISPAKCSIASGNRGRDGRTTDLPVEAGQESKQVAEREQNVLLQSSRSRLRRKSDSFRGLVSQSDLQISSSPEFLPSLVGQSFEKAVQSPGEKYSALLMRKIRSMVRPSRLDAEGRIAIVTTREAGMRWTQRRRARFSCGRTTTCALSSS